MGFPQFLPLRTNISRMRESMRFLINILRERPFSTCSCFGRRNLRNVVRVGSAIVLQSLTVRLCLKIAKIDDIAVAIMHNTIETTKATLRSWLFQNGVPENLMEAALQYFGAERIARQCPELTDDDLQSTAAVHAWVLRMPDDAKKALMAARTLYTRRVEEPMERATVGTVLTPANAHTRCSAGDVVCDKVAADTLLTNAQLGRGQRIRSSNGQYLLVHQADGNVVLYLDRVPLWATHTCGRETTHFIMQGDGNLVLYNGSRPLWASNTCGRGDGCRLMVQDDGNVVMYDARNAPVWASKTQGP